VKIQSKMLEKLFNEEKLLKFIKIHYRDVI
jgi:hypothetical protein